MLSIIAAAAPVHARASRRNNGPGPNALIAGDGEWGYYGTLSLLVDGAELASAIGLTTGTAINNAVDWLKFNAKGKTLFVPMKPLRKTLSWYDIYKSGAVYGSDDFGVTPPKTKLKYTQNRQVTIDGRTYRVRLMKGFNTEPYVGSQGYIVVNQTESEFNRLMLAVLGGANVGQVGPDWASFTMADLGMDGPDAARVYVQEASNGLDSFGDNWRIYVGRPNDPTVAYNAGLANTASVAYGWRPVLELID